MSLIDLTTHNNKALGDTALDNTVLDNTALDNTALDNTANATWRSQGRCVDGAATMTNLFFSEDLHDIARAKAICAKCSVTEQCLERAVRLQEPWGVWGGEFVMNGKIMANKRARGRPPKIPRAELVVDEVPVPPYLLPTTVRVELVKSA